MTTGDDDDSKSFHPLPLWLKTLILLVFPASVLANGSYRAIPWFSTCPKAWSNCVDLGPRTVEEQKHCATNFHHGRGIWHVRRLQTRRRDQLTLPQTHCQSPDGQSDHTHHRRLLKFKLPHCGQVQSPLFFFHFHSGSTSRCVPQSHHCVKRMFTDPR